MQAYLKKIPHSYFIQDDITRIMISSVFFSTNCNSYVYHKTRDYTEILIIDRINLMNNYI